MPCYSCPGELLIYMVYIHRYALLHVLDARGNYRVGDSTQFLTSPFIYIFIGMQGIIIPVPRDPFHAWSYSVSSHSIDIISHSYACRGS